MHPTPAPDAPGTVLEPSESSSSKNSSRPGPEPRPDVGRICAHLADRIEANGSKRPTVTARWRTEARLLLDRDGRTVDQVLRAIDWCQNDPFWRSNVLSMPKLRERYDQLRLAATRPEVRAGPGTDLTIPGTGKSTADKRLADALALADKYRQEDGS
jgi:hypothetical protein